MLGNKKLPPRWKPRRHLRRRGRVLGSLASSASSLSSSASSWPRLLLWLRSSSSSSLLSSYSPPHRRRSCFVGVFSFAPWALSSLFCCSCRPVVVHPALLPFSSLPLGFEEMNLRFNADSAKSTPSHDILKIFRDHMTRKICWVNDSVQLSSRTYLLFCEVRMDVVLG